MAREMVLTWGMGEELGPVNYSGDPMRDMYFPYTGSDHSQKTAELIDKEVRQLIDEAYSKAKELIESNKNELQALAEALIKYETLDAEDVKVILDGGELEKPTVSDLLAIEQKRNQATEQQNTTEEKADTKSQAKEQENPG